MADGSRSIIRLHCDITDVIAAARRRPREACRSEVALCSGRKLRAHRLDPRDPAGHRAPDRLGVILLEEMQARAETNQRAVLQGGCKPLGKFRRNQSAGLAREQ